MSIYTKYQKWYDNIIQSAINEDRSRSKFTYYENHHIIPSSLGGSNHFSNKVLLTAKEHFICHHLLTKFTEGADKVKMMYAYNCFVFGLGFASNRRIDGVKVTSRQYNYQKEQLSLHLKKKGVPWSPNDWMIGKTKEEIRDIHKKKGRPGKSNGFYGKKHSKKSMEQMVETRRKNGSYDSSPSAKEITIDGVLYKSRSEASRQLNIGYGKLRGMIKRGEIG